MFKRKHQFEKFLFIYLQFGRSLRPPQVIIYILQYVIATRSRSCEGQQCFDTVSRPLRESRPRSQHASSSTVNGLHSLLLLLFITFMVWTKLHSVRLEGWVEGMGWLFQASLTTLVMLAIGHTSIHEEAISLKSCITNLKIQIIMIN